MNLRSFVFLTASFFYCISCNQQKTKISVKANTRQPIDYKSYGLINLGTSNVMQDILCQNWEYKSDLEDIKDMSITSDMEVVYRGYSFFTDGSVVKDPRGDMQFGKWRINEKEKPVTIYIDYAAEKTTVNRLAYLAPYEMIFAEINGSGKKNISLSAEAIRHVNAIDDPFYRDNLIWRVKPAAAENDKAIKKRLKGCIHFFELFYDEKINEHADRVSFLGLPSCFVWHAGGIFLQKQDELQPKWMRCFYNKEQALKAWRLAEKLLNKKYEWPKKESNWLKLNVAVLKQMEKEVDNIN